jgi:hypothetical protein
MAFRTFYDILMRIVIIKENFSGYEIVPDSRLGIWTVFNAGRLRIVRVMPEFDQAAGFEGMQDELQPMSAFLGSYLGENTVMNGHWNMDFSQAGTS